MSGEFVGLGEGKMSSHDILTLLAILACVRDRTHLVAFNEGNRVLSAGGLKAKKWGATRRLRDAISALVDGGRSRLGGARISRFVFRRRNAEPDQEPMENEAKGK